MRELVFVIGFLGLLAGCSADWDKAAQNHGKPGVEEPAAKQMAVARVVTRPYSEVASLPDRGDLMAYDKVAQPVQRGAYTWHSVQLSEEHALRAIVGRVLNITAPNGQSIRLHYERHVEHPDGNWTWIGRPAGAAPGVEAILTFGEKAVFGSIPYGDAEPLRLTMAAGRTWLVETDRSKIAVLHSAGAHPSETDFLLPPKLRRAARPLAGLSTAASTIEALNMASTVDVVLGFTNGFATRLGGQSQAVTRLNFLIDVTNQALANSQIDAQVRLVHAMLVTYPDTTANKTALYALSGVDCVEGGGCTDAEVPAALQPLLAARDQYGADLVSLVRKFEDPENGSCGIAWLLGGGQDVIDAESADFGLSVVSDSSGNQFPDNGFICRDETMAHELGHNMGSQHDRATAGGTDDSNSDGNLLDPEEYGRYPYSFGYKTSAGGGNFYTVMAYGETGQTKYRLFSNPRITSCGGFACGITNQADNALSLGQTMPVIASFRSQAVPTFSDVPASYWAFDFIERVYAAGVTAGCATGPLRYCPEDDVSRDQMAVFLIRALYGSTYTPPAPAGVFADVPTNYWAAPWIELLAQIGITSGCGTNPLRYCPASQVTRDQMAVFLLRAKYGAGYSPPPATGMFVDVPVNYWAATWIEQLAREGITSGCATNPASYCPASTVSRAQMATFMVRTFGL